MSRENTRAMTPWWFWMISILALLWYCFGAVQFFGSLVATPEGMADYVTKGTMTQDYADFLLALPIWVKAAFGIATIGGLLASICLLMRKAIAPILFMLSLAGAFLMYLYLFVLSGKADILPVSDFIIAACVVVVTCLMIWFSRRMIANGILG